MPVQDLADDPDAVLVVADVALMDGHALVGVLVGEVPGVVVLARVAPRHLHPPVHQPLADGQPDAAGPAGDHRDLPVHVTHGAPPKLPVWRTCPWHPAGRSPAATRRDSPAALRRTPGPGSTSGPRTACRPPARGPAASRPSPAMPTACSRPQPPTRGESPRCAGRALNSSAASSYATNQASALQYDRASQHTGSTGTASLRQSRDARSILMRAFEVSRDQVSVRLLNVSSLGLRCVTGASSRGCRRCGPGGAGSAGCGSRRRGGLRVWRAGSGFRRWRW